MPMRPMPLSPPSGLPSAAITVMRSAVGRVRDDSTSLSRDAKKLERLVAEVVELGGVARLEALVDELVEDRVEQVHVLLELDEPRDHLLRAGDLPVRRRRQRAVLDVAERADGRLDDGRLLVDRAKLPPRRAEDARRARTVRGAERRSGDSGRGSRVSRPTQAFFVSSSASRSTRKKSGTRRERLQLRSPPLLFLLTFGGTDIHVCLGHDPPL